MQAAGSTVATLFAIDSLQAEVSFLGVASGDASSNEAIIWTRALDATVPVGSLVTAQVSADPAFGTILAAASGTPSAVKDYTIKFDIKGLVAGTQYYYRFQGPNGETSIQGTFKTAPDAQTAAPVRFAFSGDCDGKMRPYPLTRGFDTLNLDFFSFIGDTEYETASTGSPAVTSTDSATKAQLFSQFSRKYREQFGPVTPGGQNGLQTFFASQGNFTLMDNHELGNKRYMNGGAPAGGAITTDPVNLPTGKGFAGTTADGVDVNTTGTFLNKAAGFQTLEQVY
ncbi:MAG: Alkaline phosphatase D-related protein, partial [Verrucomicrobiales bacterium]|nr:Alkaline phosphatase D-related protein [Verrucomicrobiales bacterium]